MVKREITQTNGKSHLRVTAVKRSPESPRRKSVEREREIGDREGESAKNKRKKKEERGE